MDVERAAADPRIAMGKKPFSKSTTCSFSRFQPPRRTVGLRPNDDNRSDGFAPPECAGDAGKKRAWAVEAMKNSARAAKNLGLSVVNGFTGSSIWHLLYSFPPVADETIDQGYEYFR